MADYKCTFVYVRMTDCFVRESIIIYKQKYPSSVLNLFYFLTVKRNVFVDVG